MIKDRTTRQEIKKDIDKLSAINAPDLTDTYRWHTPAEVYIIFSRARRINHMLNYKTNLITFEKI